MSKTAVNHRYVDPTDVDEALEQFRKLRTQYSDFLADDLSEADTRSKVIDSILCDVLGWSEHGIVREKHVEDTGTFLDYCLSTTHPCYVIEAKRKKVQFAIPSQATRRQYKVGGVLSEDAVTRNALQQVRNYALSKGVGFCCLTNGVQFIFFRSQNDHGIEWGDHLAVVFRDHDEIEKHFAKFFNLLSYDAVSTGVAHTHLPVSQNYSEQLRRFKSLDLQQFVLNRTRERNRLFPILKDVIQRVFQDLSSQAAHTDLLKNCYVETARASSYERGMDGLLRARPIAIGTAVKPLVVEKKSAGDFQKSLERQWSTNQSTGEVVLLLGGVGVGKTTFIHRFRRIIASDQIDRQCLWAHLDFTKFTSPVETISQWAAKRILSEFEAAYPDLEVATFKVLKQAYHSEYERLRAGKLAPLFAKDPALFEIEFAAEVSKEETSDPIGHVIKVIRALNSRLHRRPFLVFDNADQFNADVQNQVFLIAQRFADEGGTAAIISLREESYWKNKEYGVLSAFHALSFQVAAPRLNQVISKRFRYARQLLIETDTGIDFASSDEQPVSRTEVAAVLDRIVDTIITDDKRFVELLENLSPGEIRRPLDHLARFLYSGHTNLDSLLAAVRRGNGNLKIGFHEFLTSIILGDREYFTEGASDIVNLFHVDGREDASNLNRIAVIGRVLKDQSLSLEVGKGFVPITEVVAECELLGIAPDTTRSILALLNRRRLLETETQIRDDVATSSFIRGTAAAPYYLTKLLPSFAYVDTMLADSAIGQGRYLERIQKLTQEIASLQSADGATRLRRVEKRLERARVFLNYVCAEYSESSLKRNRGLVSPSVHEVFEALQGQYLRESHQILERAKAIFK